MGKPAKNQAQAALDQAFLDNVLSYDGQSYKMLGGFEMTFMIRKVEATPARPHGFEYAFVLLGPDRSGQRGRIMGFDNAHAADGVKTPYDHEHRVRRARDGSLLHSGKPVARAVTSIDVSIADFFQRVHALLVQEGIERE